MKHLKPPISAGSKAERVPWVPKHPLKCSNGCQAPILTRRFRTKVFKCSQIFCIFGVKFVCPRIFFSWAPVFWRLWHRPCIKISLFNFAQTDRGDSLKYHKSFTKTFWHQLCLFLFFSTCGTIQFVVSNFSWHLQMKIDNFFFLESQDLVENFQNFCYPPYFKYLWTFVSRVPLSY